MKSKPVLVIGGGGHARVLLDLLQRAQREIVGIIDKDKGRSGMDLLGVKTLGDESLLSKYPPREYELVNGIGSTSPASLRAEIFRRLKGQGYVFATLVDPRAFVAPDARLEEGAQVLAGAMVQTGVRVGENSIVNTSASVDHECVIQAHVHIAPGATLSGNVEIGELAHIGVGACVIQGVRIGRGAMVAAGAAVTQDVAPQARVGGVPARPLSEGT